jgi:hypothetical protein
MKKYFKYILCSLIGMMYFPLTAQIVNIEKERIKAHDSAGIEGQMNLSVQLNENKGLVFFSEINPHLQYKRAKHLLLFVGHWDYTYAAKKVLNHGAFAHLRYNYALFKRIKWELFQQIQYNKIWNMPFRYLSGTGPRFKLLDWPNTKLYAGPLYIFEWQRVGAYGSDLFTHRLSSYISWNAQYKDLYRFSGTFYYQPNWINWRDTRFSTLVELQFKLNRQFSFDHRFTWIHDATGVVDIPLYTYRYTLGLGYRF